MGTDAVWIRMAAFFLTVEYAFAMFIGAKYGFSYNLALAEQLSVAAVISTGLVAWTFVRSLFQSLRTRQPSPANFLKGRLFSPLLAARIAGVSFVTLQIGALNWTKSMMPLVTSFWADNMLADFDKALFGVDPWAVFHLINVPMIDEIYSTWAIVKFSALFTLLLLPQSARKAKALTAYFAVMFLGMVGQYCLPSAGPIFWNNLGLGDRYTAIPIPDMTRMARDYLWQYHQLGRGQVGTGISAFPSMHVAIATWLALMSNSFDKRLGMLGWFYWTCIMFGSVYLGWHYIADGIGGSMIAVAAWKFANLCLAKFCAVPSAVQADGANVQPVTQSDFSVS